jgi:hypothetical protein
MRCMRAYVLCQRKRFRGSRPFVDDRRDTANATLASALSSYANDVPDRLHEREECQAKDGRNQIYSVIGVFFFLMERLD